MIYLDNYIDGKLLKPISEKYLDNYEPATGLVFSQVPDSSKEDLELAVRASEKAFASWSALRISDRSMQLYRLADLIEKKQEQLALAESLDTGKPLWLAKKVDIPRAISNFRFFAAAIVNETSDACIMEGEAVNYTRRAPVGTVGCISPWNLPLYLLSWKIAPALATGNCVIAKPSEIAPYTAHLLGEICIEAGLPAGVLNIVHGKGSGIGQQIVSHPAIKAISFTGGTKTGRLVNVTAADQFKKVSLELGGKNPVIIFKDCDFQQALEIGVKSAFTNQGEICLCGSRILIEKPLYEKFKEEFTQKVKKLIVGLPRHQVDLGAIISQSHLAKIKHHVELAKNDGGRLLCGGSEIKIDNGYFFEPTVIEGLDVSCQLNQQEVFGPVVTLSPFSSEEEAISIANGTAYGLAAVICTNDLKRAHRVSHLLKAGVIWVNCWMLRDLRTPFGGLKHSGVGKEGGSEALRFFTEAKNICIRI